MLGETFRRKLHRNAWIKCRGKVSFDDCNLLKLSHEISPQSSQFELPGYSDVTHPDRRAYLEEFRHQSKAGSAGIMCQSVPLTTKGFLKKKFQAIQKGSKVQLPCGTVVDARDARKKGSAKMSHQVCNNGLKLMGEDTDRGTVCLQEEVEVDVLLMMSLKMKLKKL